MLVPPSEYEQKKSFCNRLKHTLTYAVQEVRNIIFPTDWFATGSLPSYFFLLRLFLRVYMFRQLVFKRLS